jgi:hypothetical protein
MKMGIGRIIDILETKGEIVFIALGIATLPIWFPILVLWVVIDPKYRIKKILQTRKERNHSIEHGKKLSPLVASKHLQNL